MASTAYTHWKDFDLISSEKKQKSASWSKPAMFMFAGPAYLGLNPLTLTSQMSYYLQANMKIIDPLYGCLQPLDKIQPYRLEMATKKISSSDENFAGSMSQFWAQSVTSHLCNDLQKRSIQSQVLLNLASDEYSATVLAQDLPPSVRYVKVVFQQDGKVISVHAKKARGLMGRFLAEHEVMDLEAVKEFDLEGYAYVKERSKKDMLVFDRKKQAPEAKRKEGKSKKNGKGPAKKKKER